MSFYVLQGGIIVHLKNSKIYFNGSTGFGTYSSTNECGLLIFLCPPVAMCSVDSDAFSAGIACNLYASSGVLSACFYFLRGVPPKRYSGPAKNSLGYGSSGGTWVYD